MVCGVDSHSGKKKKSLPSKVKAKARMKKKSMKRKRKKLGTEISETHQQYALTYGRLINWSDCACVLRFKILCVDAQHV